MRGWIVLLLLVGCDQVYGLEGRLPPEARPGDEDGDGRLDEKDPCPHIADETATDLDDDGISADCDPDDQNAETMFRWFPITAGSIDGLRAQGVGAIADDGYLLGNPVLEGHSSLLFEVDTGTAIVDVGFEMIANSIEDSMAYPWAEMGVMTVHRSFIPPGQLRGDVCFYGISFDDTMDPTIKNYLEMNEDTQRNVVQNFPAPLNGTSGTLHIHRTPELVRCEVIRSDGTINGEFAVSTLAMTTGKIAIAAERVVTKLTYVWIAWQPKAAQ